jgi:leader peptidase (prepilin peptidase)/N-methyltransferase
MGRGRLTSGPRFFLFAAAVAYPAGMGMGDVKLALLMGAALGKFVSVALFAGMIFALVPSVFLLARHGSSARKMGIPFAPFLALGSVVALFAGGALLHAYWAFFHPLGTSSKREKRSGFPSLAPIPHSRD